LGLKKYEENDLVLNIIYDLKLFFQEISNCICHYSSKQKDPKICFEKIGFKRFFERHFEIKSLKKPELNLFIKAQLMSFEISNEKFQSNNEDIEMLNESNKIIQPQHRHRYRFNFNSSLPVCKPTYLKLYNINENLLLILQNHL